MRPPSVDTIARSLADTGLPHPLLVEAARAGVAAAPDGAEAAARVEAERLSRTLLRPVVNATGVLLHTNLGRAPLAVSVPAAASNLELDLTTGRRGSRTAHVGRLLSLVCGAEAALVVNNGAAAVLLALAATARGKGVVVSRGELVEIGGGFRIPEVLEQSGAELVEVGTTNRTTRSDYATALAGDEPARAEVVLKVHRSNYRITGFTAEVDVAALAGLGAPVLVDLGSGLLDTATPWLPGGPPDWLRDEPAVRQTLAAGATLVTFSGDKLLGGPQAGLIVGDRTAVDACALHPLYRALRPGGLVLSALHDVLLAYLRRDADRLPLWRMATASVDGLQARAAALVAAAGGRSAVVASTAVMGGGTLPGVEIPSVGIAIDGDHTTALRHAAPPIVARVEAGRTVLDLRTVDPADDDAVTAAVAGIV